MGALILFLADSSAAALLLRSSVGGLTTRRVDGSAGILSVTISRFFFCNIPQCAYFEQLFLMRSKNIYTDGKQNRRNTVKATDAEKHVVKFCKKYLQK